MADDGAMSQETDTERARWLAAPAPEHGHMSQETDTERVRAAAERVFLELGPSCEDEVYRAALGAALPESHYESVAFVYRDDSRSILRRKAAIIDPTTDATEYDVFQFRYNLTGTQHTDLVWRHLTIEVETSPEGKDMGAAHFTHAEHACRCHRNVVLVYVTPTGAQVRRYGAQ